MSDQNPTPAESKTNIPWFKKKAIVIPLGVLVFIIVLNVTRGAVDSTSSPESSDSSNSIATDEPTATNEPEVTKEPEVTEEPEPVVTEEPEPEGPVETTGQSNARESAENYISFSAFSRKGLIEQLKFEDYSTADATYAVDAISVDWNEQAAKAAENYLSFSSFSRDSLIDQLVFEGYTQSQASYGATAAGY